MPKRLDGVFATLDAGALRRRMDSMLADMGASEAAAPRALAEHYLTHLEGVAQSLRDVCPDGDTYELSQTLANAWLELQLIWNRCNQQMQYQNMQDGASPGLMAVCALIGQVLESLREFLDVDRLMLVDKIGKDPYETARLAAEQNSRLLERMSSASDGANRAVEALLIALDKLQDQLGSTEDRRELDKTVEMVVEEIERALVMTGEDIGAALEARLLRALDGAALRVLPRLQGFDRKTWLPGDVARLLVDLGEEWALAVKAHAPLRDAAQRMADQQAAFVTMRVQLKVEANEVTLSFSDDGDGDVVYVRSQPSDAVHNVRVQLTQTAGRGSVLEARCSLRKVVDYLVVQCIDDASDGWLAVPLNAVESIEQRGADNLRIRGTVLTARDGGETIPVVDAGQLLFQVDNLRRQEDSYVLLRLENGHRMALRVSGIDGTLRASLHAVPRGLKSTRLRGFIQSQGRVIGVLDLAEISLLQRSACPA